MKAHEYEKAESYYQRSLEVCAKRENELGSIAAVRDVAIPLIVIGDIKKAQGDNSAALNYYLRAKAKFDIIKGKVEIVIPSIRRDTALLLEKIGNEYSDEKKSKDAESAYLEALEEFRILREETDSTNARRDLTRILEKVGDMQSNLENWNGAEASYSAALEDLRGLKDGTDSLAVLCPLVSLLEKLGNIRHDIGDDEDAGKCFEEGAEAFGKLADITGAAGDKRGTAYCLLMLGETKAKRDPDGAYQCMQEACKEFKKLTEAYYEQWSYEDLAKSCYRLAVIRKPYDIDSLRESKEVDTSDLLALRHHLSIICRVLSSLGWKRYSDCSKEDVVLLCQKYVRCAEVIAEDSQQFDDLYLYRESLKLLLGEMNPYDGDIYDKTLIKAVAVARKTCNHTAAGPGDYYQLLDIIRLYGIGWYRANEKYDRSVSITSGRNQAQGSMG